MNFFSFFILLLSLNPNPPIAKEVLLIRATEQIWMGSSTGKGVNYRITLKVNKSSRRLKFQHLQIDNKEYPFSLLKKEDTCSTPRFRKNDTIYLVAGYFENSPDKKPMDTTAAKPSTTPSSTKTGRASITYRVGKKKIRTLEVERFDRLQNIVLP